METVSLYSKSGELIGSFPLPKELCFHLKQLPTEEAVKEIADMVLYFLEKEANLKLTLEQVLSEVGKITLCGKEIVVGGGNPA